MPKQYEDADIYYKARTELGNDIFFLLIIIDLILIKFSEVSFTKNVAITKT